MKVKLLAAALLLLCLASLLGCSAKAIPGTEQVILFDAPVITPAVTGADPVTATGEPTAPTQEPMPELVGPAAESTSPYYLYIEKGSFTLTIYERDETGNFTKVYAAYRVAHGGNKTPAGKFTLGDKDRWHEFPDGGFVQYATRYHARLYLHSPLYGEENAGKLWPKYYDGELGIGGESTGGCLRMVTEAAKFIYDNCPEDTILEIVNGAPLGTTSEEVPSRNGKRFDPTDEEYLSR